MATLSELAVSLNSHEAQILNRQGSEWAPSITLSEVSPRLAGVANIQPESAAARQVDHFYRLGS